MTDTFTFSYFFHASFTVFSSARLAMAGKERDIGHAIIDLMRIFQEHLEAVQWPLEFSFMLTDPVPASGPCPPMYVEFEVRSFYGHFDIDMRDPQAKIEVTSIDQLQAKLHDLFNQLWPHFCTVHQQEHPELYQLEFPSDYHVEYRLMPDTVEDQVRDDEDDDHDDDDEWVTDSEENTIEVGELLLDLPALD